MPHLFAPDFMSSQQTYPTAKLFDLTPTYTPPGEQVDETPYFAQATAPPPSYFTGASTDTQPLIQLESEPISEPVNEPLVQVDEIHVAEQLPPPSVDEHNDHAEEQMFERYRQLVNNSQNENVFDPSQITQFFKKKKSKGIFTYQITSGDFKIKKSKQTDDKTNKLKYKLKQYAEMYEKESMMNTINIDRLQKIAKKVPTVALNISKY